MKERKRKKKRMSEAYENIYKRLRGGVKALNVVIKSDIMKLYARQWSVKRNKRGFTISKYVRDIHLIGSKGKKQKQTKRKQIIIRQVISTFMYLSYITYPFIRSFIHTFVRFLHHLFTFPLLMSTGRSWWFTITCHQVGSKFLVIFTNEGTSNNEEDRTGQES